MATDARMTRIFKQTRMTWLIVQTYSIYIIIMLGYQCVRKSV
jgi:hypothetical protein